MEILTVASVDPATPNTGVCDEFIKTIAKAWNRCNANWYFT